MQVILGLVMSRHDKKSAPLACSAVLGFALMIGGCAFVPRGESVAHETDRNAAAPDREAPRLQPLDTRKFAGLPESTELVGQVQVLFARYENTFSAIARTYDLGYNAMKQANPGVDAWLPGEGTPIYLPTRSILPDAPREGIVINLPAMRLYYFRDGPEHAGESGRMSVTTYPIGIGRDGWETPTGTAKVTQKISNPAWYVPASVRKEHAEAGDPLPAVVPPGPDNPLGLFALQLSLPGYLIHGTNKPAGVGMRVSHGCIRLYPEDIESLFRAVPRGTPVRIVDQPVLAGWAGGELFLEAHPALDAEGRDDQARDLAAEAARVIAAAIDRAGRPQVSLNRQAIARVIAERRGIPFPVGNTQRSLADYLSASRIIDNTVPLPQTASAED
ncbi:MAG TPA: L,D-transpeptidase family protein [Gammaproteobacteria bacterium]|nr:L,D-transpeptidase family protein [Gammaproteobacteria bacterium]